VTRLREGDTGTDAGVPRRCIDLDDEPASPGRAGNGRPVAKVGTVALRQSERKARENTQGEDHRDLHGDCRRAGYLY
jgi:hypothetical protein